MTAVYDYFLRQCETIKRCVDAKSGYTVTLEGHRVNAVTFHGEGIEFEHEYHGDVAFENYNRSDIERMSMDVAEEFFLIRFAFYRK